MGSQMKIYNYDADTGIYTHEGVADESPLEENVWLIPANATTEAPPKTPAGKAAAFVNGAWEIVEAPLQPEPMKPQPVKPIEAQELQNTRARQYLYSTDWYVIRSIETGAPIPDDITKARAEARASIVE